MFKQILFILACLVSQLTIGQIAPYCSPNTITTDPDYPGNQGLFDWRINPLNNGVVYVYDGPNIVSYPNIIYPYFGASTNPNLNIPASAIIKDYKPEDGWEVVYTSFGTPNNGTDDPVFFLYNRYRSILRVFILLLNEEALANKAMVYLEWESFGSTNTGNAYLSAYNSPMDALDKFNKHKKNIHLVKANHMVNDDRLWLFADFPIVYDPCICSRTSLLAVKSALIDVGDIQMEINNKVISNSGVVAGGVTQTGSDWFKAAFGSLDSDVSKEIKVIKDNFHLLKITDTKAMEDHTFNGTLKNLKNAGILSTSVGWIKGISSTINILDYFVAGGSATPLEGDDIPNVMVTPASTAKGTVEYIRPFSYNSFLAPGANSDGVEEDLIPLYNNPLGILNLLETPKVEFLRYYLVGNQTPSGAGSQTQNGFLNEHLPHVKQYRLSKEIKYAVNPSSGLELKSIEGSFVYRTGGPVENNSTVKSNYAEGTIFPPGSSQGFPIYLPAGPATLKPIDFNNYENSLFDQNIEITLWEKDDGDGLDSLYFKTPYTSLNCIETNQFRLFSNTLYDRSINIQSDPNKPPKYVTSQGANKPEIYFRIRAILNRKDGLGEPVIFIATYNVDEPKEVIYEEHETADLFLNNEEITDISQLINHYSYPFSFHVGNFSNNNNGSWINMLDNVPQNLSLTAPNIYPVDDYYASNEVTLSGNSGQSLSILSGTTITAGNKITVNNNVLLNSNVTLSIAPHPHGYGCDGILPQVSSEELASFCTNEDKYKPLYFKNTSIEKNENFSESNFKLTYSLRPNPAKDYVNIIISEDDYSSEIWVTDLSGKTVISPSHHDQSSISIPVMSLASGMYFVFVKVNDQVTSKKLIISR